MVQVIDRPPSFGETLGQLLGGTASGYAQGKQQVQSTGLQQMLADMFEENKQKKAYAKVNEEIAKLPQDASIFDKLSIVAQAPVDSKTKEYLLKSFTQQGTKDFINKVSKEGFNDANILEGMSLGIIPPGYGQELGRQVREQNFLSKYFPDLGQQSRGNEVIEENETVVSNPTGSMMVQEGEVEPIRSLSNPLPDKVPRNTKTGQGWEKYSDDDLTLMRAAGGNIGESAAKELNRREKIKEREFKQSESEEKKRQFAHKETAKYFTDLEEGSENAQEVLQAVNEVKKLASKGITGTNLQNLLVSFLKNRKSFLTNAFVDKDIQSLISATKTLAGGFRDLFGSRPTEREFFWYENILPDILKDADTNIEAADYFGRLANFRIDMQEAADEIVRDNGGYRPIDLSLKVREKMKPKLTKLLKEGEELHRRIEREAPSRSKENLLRKVEKGTPLTEELVQSFLEYTGNDPDRAARIATQLGYDVNKVQ